MLTRREFFVVGAAITAGTAYTASAQQPAASAKPSILFILADDLGWGDLSCYGRPDYKTPVLDDLAARGIRLTQAYANSSTGRGRDAGCPAPPAQIPACAPNALGSCLGYERRSAP
jgi:hypothetical protein